MPALWVGLLYDAEALDAAEELAKGLNAADVEKARMDVACHGLNASVGDRSVLDLARRMVDIASDGLSRRHRLDSSDNDESGFLDPVRQIAASGETCAETLLNHFEVKWAGSLEPLYRECQF